MGDQNKVNLRHQKRVESAIREINKESERTKESVVSLRCVDHIHLDAQKSVTPGFVQRDNDKDDDLQDTQVNSDDDFR